MTVNIVDEGMLKKADYVGCVSGNTTDKSEVFAYHTAETGAPIIDESPVVMEYLVDDIYRTNGFESFICKISAVHAEKGILNEDISLCLIFSLAACSQTEKSDTSSEQPPASNSLEATDMKAP